MLGLEGQLFGIDLLDDGLYFGLDGPTYRFPAQLSDINTLRNSLEILYFFKVRKLNLSVSVLLVISNAYKDLIVGKCHQ